ncbi:DUF2829 domain-containing protein [Persephonella sp.]
MDKEFFDFGTAINYLKQGKRVARKGWNGKGMYIFLMPDSWVKAIEDIKLPDYPIDKCLCMKTAANTIQLGWLASQADMMANDWCLVEKINP